MSTIEFRGCLSHPSQSLTNGYSCPVRDTCSDKTSFAIRPWQAAFSIEGNHHAHSTDYDRHPRCSVHWNNVRHSGMVHPEQSRRPPQVRTPTQSPHPTLRPVHRTYPRYSQSYGNTNQRIARAAPTPPGMGTQTPLRQSNSLPQGCPVAPPNGDGRSQIAWVDWPTCRNWQSSPPQSSAVQHTPRH